MGLNIGLKEWSCVVEALRKGMQTVTVRSYQPKTNEFFLYPTYSYLSTTGPDPTSFDSHFQQPYREMARRSAEETTKRGRDELLVDVTCHAKVTDVLLIAESEIWKDLSSHFIWSSNHVVEYARKARHKVAYLWILRVYTFPETEVLGRWSVGGPPDYYRHDKEISTANSTPVLTEEKFAAQRNQIKQTLKQHLSMAEKRSR